MSHELRTPLSAMIGFTDILHQEVRDEAAQEKLTAIRRNGDYLLRLLGDVLDLSRIEAGKFDLKKQSVELEELLRDVHDTMQMRSNDYNNKLEFHYPNPLPPIVQTDPSRLRQVLINLIANALKFAPNGKVDLWVRVDDRANPPQLVFEVVDDGIGISATQQQQLFKPFSQADETISARFGGTGLGLSITRRLVEAMGGSVSVQSELDRGSQFSVRLPLSVRHSRVQFAIAERIEEDTEEEPDAPPAAPALPTGLKVLIADDIRDVRFIAQHFLIKAGCVIETAENGQQAIDQIRKAARQDCPFDLALMDMQMPVMDGEAAVRQLRAEANAIPVIALTADAMKGTRRRLLEAGFDEYLCKPLRPARLLEVIGRLVAPPTVTVNRPDDSMPATRTATSLGLPTRDAHRFLPEGPQDLGDGRISWIAIQHGFAEVTGSLHQTDLASGTDEVFDLPGRPGFAIPCDSAGRYVIGMDNALGFYDTATRTWEPFLHDVDAQTARTIINDGMAHEDNLIFGTKELTFSKTVAGLYLFRGRDQKLTRLRGDQICSNGKVILRHDDGLHLYDIDSPTKKIVRYQIDIDAATIGEPTTIVDLGDEPAVPDGMTVTPDGRGLIVAIFKTEPAAAGETRCYDIATGEVTDVWRTPQSPQNTCPRLVRVKDDVKLIITTAVENMTPEVLAGCPQAGLLFIGETDYNVADLPKPVRYPA